MTFAILKQVIEENNIPEDVQLMSDSGWECCATRMDGVYYNESANLIVFTQCPSKYDDEYYAHPDLWKLIYGELPEWQRIEEKE